MRGFGRRSVIVGVVLATTMSAGVALAADPALPAGFLKTALTAPGERDTTARSALLQLALNDGVVRYSLATQARLANTVGRGEMSNIKLAVTVADELGAGGYANSLRAARAERDSGLPAFAGQLENAEPPAAPVAGEELQEEPVGTLDILPAMVAGETSGTVQLSGSVVDGSAAGAVARAAAALQGESGLAPSTRFAETVTETSYTAHARDAGASASGALSAPSADDGLGRCAQTMPGTITGIRGDTIPAIQIGGLPGKVVLSGSEDDSAVMSYIAPPRQDENAAALSAQSASSRQSYVAAPLDNSASTFANPANAESAAIDLALLATALVGDESAAGTSFAAEQVESSVTYTALPSAEMRQ